MGLLGKIWRATLNVALVYGLLGMIPGLPPQTHFPLESISYEPKLSPVGPLAPNQHLNNAERLFAGKLHGPECLRQRGNELFVSQMGDLVKITGDHVTHVARFGKPCEAHDREICGRPLGFDFDTISDSLIVADAYFGLWTVDLRTLKKVRLVHPDDVLPGDIKRPAKIFNSVAIARNGDIFWTDSASDFDLFNGLNTFLANPSGRLFRYNRASGTNDLLLDRLHFANGVVLSPDESFVVVAETAASRLRRFWLTGPRAGQSEPFIAGLPGAPDNLSADRRGIWVPLVLTLDPVAPVALWQSAGTTPFLRKVLLRSLQIVQWPLTNVQRVAPNRYTKIALNWLGSFDMIKSLVPQHSTIVRLDWNGAIVSSLHGQDGSAASVAHVLEHDGHLLLGSFVNAHIVRVKLPKNLPLGEELFATTTTTPRPTTTTTTTTTTQRPTTTTTTTPRPTTTTTTQRPTTTTTTTTTTARPTTTTTTTARPTTTAAPKTAPTTTTVKPTTTTTTTTTVKPTTTTTTTAKPTTTAAPKRKADVHPPPPPPPTPAPEVDNSGRTVPPPQPIEEHHDEPTMAPAPPKMKVIKRGGQQGEF